jgi:hypothetical protein
MNNWWICWFFTHIFTADFHFKGFPARRVYKSFRVKGLMFRRQELQIHRLGNLLILNHTNYTHSDSVQNRSVVNDMKYNNHDKNNRCSVIPVSLESYALVKKPFFLITEALHSTEETVYIHQNMQEFYPLVFVYLYRCFKFLSLLTVYKCHTFTEGNVRYISRENVPFYLNLCYYNSKWNNENLIRCCS